MTRICKAFKYLSDDDYLLVSDMLLYIIDNTLTNKEQIVLRNIFLNGYTQNEIADILNISQSTVSRHYTSGIKKIKKEYLIVLEAIKEYKKIRGEI